MLYKKALDLVGNTPLIPLQRFKDSIKSSNNIYGKLEYFNPTGSVKDRAAKYMILDAISTGKLKKDGYIIEATSGNTGISIAYIASSLGYKSIIVMPSNMSEERKQLIKGYGASLVLTDKELGMKGAIDKAKELLEENPNSVILGQFENENNVKAHFETTGLEIWNDLNGKIDILVSTIGSGGTISGIAKYLKEKNKDIKIIGVEPSDSPLLSKGYSGTHLFQGIGANFIPKILKKEYIDSIIAITNEEVEEVKKEIIQTEGLLLGITSYVALAACKKISQEVEGKNIVVICPDNGTKYLSTEFYK